MFGDKNKSVNSTARGHSTTRNKSVNPLTLTPSNNVQKLWQTQVAYQKIIDNDLARETKLHHWAWYVFPHNRKGQSDKFKVKINKNDHIQAWIAVHHNPLKNWWSNTLNRVSKKAGGYKGFMKSNDIHRVNTFIKEWSGHLESWDKQRFPVNSKFRNAFTKMRNTGDSGGLPSSSATSLLSERKNMLQLSHERKNMLQVGYEASQQGLMPGIALAGNTGRFGGAAISFVPTGGMPFNKRKTVDEEKYESLLLKNFEPYEQMKFRYQNNHYYPDKIHPNHTTQEEAVISNIWTTCANFNEGKQLLHPDGRLKVPWGLIHPMREVSRRGSKLTFQGVDYTSKKAKPDYGKAYPLKTMASYQEFGKPWDLSKTYDCVLVVTAGPNNGNKGSSEWSSQTRTVDPNAQDYEYFKNAIVDALAATLKVMKEQRVQVAILPGLSTGLYAGRHKTKIAGDYMDLVKQAIRRIGDLSPIQKVVYCNK